MQSCRIENSAARAAIKAVGQPIRFLFTMRGILLNRLIVKAGLVRIRDYGDGIIGFGPGPDG